MAAIGRVLTVGCGSIGRRHIGNFRKAGMEVIGADTREDRRQQATDAGAARVYEDFREALRVEKVDAVIVAVPPNLHLEVGQAAAEAGAHLFIEKPLSTTLDGFAQLERLCSERNLVTFVAYCYRFIPSVHEVRELIETETIGRVYSARLEISSYLPDWHPWEDYRSFYMARTSEGGGALLDESHGVDLARHLFGEVEAVTAVVEHVSSLEIQSDDLALLIMKMSSGAFVEVHFDLLGRSPRVQLEVIGSEGTILWDRIDHKVEVFRAAEKKWETRKYTTEDVLSMYTAEVAHFADCVATGKPTLIGLADGAKTMRVLLAAQRSGREGRTVSVSEAGGV